MDKHSKWPIFMRMHGSVMPKMIMPLCCVAAWSTLITCISHFLHDRKLRPGAVSIRLTNMAHLD